MRQVVIHLVNALRRKLRQIAVHLREQSFAREHVVVQNGRRWV